MKATLHDGASFDSRASFPECCNAIVAGRARLRMRWIVDGIHKMPLILSRREAPSRRTHHAGPISVTPCQSPH
jgi:hypothetical protein